MYGKQWEASGSDNFVVGVEINQTAIVGHHHAMKEIQLLEAYVENPTYDTTRVTRKNPLSGGDYYLSF